MKKKDFLQKLISTLEITSKDPVTGDTLLEDIWDSMGQIAVLAMLEDDFKITLQMDELVSIKKVEDIIDILRSKNIVIE